MTVPRLRGHHQHKLHHLIWYNCATYCALTTKVIAFRIANSHRTGRIHTLTANCQLFYANDAGQPRIA